MSYAPVNGLQMYYAEHGSGHPLVLLHGGALTFDLTFGRMVPQLSAEHRLIGPELQGHGHTADIDREWSLTDLADDVVGLLDHLGVERADVFGFSLGGLVTLELATRHPDRLDRIVLAAAHYRHDGYHPEIMDPAQDSPLLPTEADFAEMVREHAAVAPKPEQFEEMMRKANNAINPLPGWTDDQLRAITAPTLIVVGDRDFVRLEHAVAMHDLIPDAQLAVLPDTTHMDVSRKPDLLVPMVARFLSRRP